MGHGHNGENQISQQTGHSLNRVDKNESVACERYYGSHDWVGHVLKLAIGSRNILFQDQTEQLAFAINHG